MASARDALDLPRPFGPYTLLRRIAVGGMAEVYVAKAKGIGGFEKLVAIKVIHPRFSEDQHFVQMLVEEAKLSVLLTHANIGQTFDLGCIDGTYCIVLELIEGADCSRILHRANEKRARLPVDLCAYIASEICQGLDYAHRKRDINGAPLNIVHRDISPQNVLISFAGEVKLVDFGIAKAALRTSEATQAGVIKGKYYYMSPEQAWADPVDARSDVFSCGVVLHELLTGDMLYQEDNLPLLIDKVRKAEVQPPSATRSSVPAELDAIVMKALAKEPKDRFQTAHDFGQALTQFLYGHLPTFTPARMSGLMGQLFPKELEAASESVAEASMPEPLLSEVDKALVEDSTFAGDTASATLDVMKADEFLPDATQSIIYLSAFEAAMGPFEGDDDDLEAGATVVAAGLMGDSTSPQSQGPEWDDPTLTGKKKRAQKDVAPLAPERTIVERDKDVVRKLREGLVRSVTAARAQPFQVPSPKGAKPLDPARTRKASRPMAPPATFKKPEALQAPVSVRAPSVRRAPSVAPRPRNATPGPVAVPPVSVPPVGKPPSIAPSAAAQAVPRSVVPPAPAALRSVPPPAPQPGPRMPPAVAPQAPQAAAPQALGRVALKQKAEVFGGLPGKRDSSSPSWPPGQPQSPVPANAPVPSRPAQAPAPRRAVNTGAFDAVVPGAGPESTQELQAQLSPKRPWKGVFAGLALVAVVAGAALFALRQPEQRPPMLEVRSVPEGALVYLDGQLLPGETPLSGIAGLEVDQRYEVRVELSGHEPWSTSFRAQEGTISQIAVLRAMRRSVTIESSPLDAQIWVNDVLHGRAPIRLSNIPVGEELRLRAVIQGRRMDRTVVVSPDLPSELVLEVPE